MHSNSAIAGIVVILFLAGCTQQDNSLELKNELDVTIASELYPKNQELNERINVRIRPESESLTVQQNGDGSGIQTPAHVTGLRVQSSGQTVQESEVTEDLIDAEENNLINGNTLEDSANSTVGLENSESGEMDADNSNVSSGNDRTGSLTVPQDTTAENNSENINAGSNAPSFENSLPENNSSTAAYAFQDDFSHGLQHWTEVFNGYGQIWMENEQVNLRPKTSVSAGENHAPLLVSNSGWENFTLELDQRTVQQLQQNTPPDTWEVAWVMFRYTNLENYYYFILKTNGVQLAKKQGSLNEIFLVTLNTPRVQIGQWNHIKITANGNHIQTWVDGQLAIDYTDANPLSRGKIGLYNEDAWTQADNVRIQAN